jgi:Flp pilus assembly pilin Flp
MLFLSRLSCAIGADRRGITALEYALLSAVISGFVVLAAFHFGTDLGGAYNTIGNTLVSTASPAAPPPTSAPTGSSPPKYDHHYD